MRSLSEIRRDELEEYIFPGTDAAVFVFPKAVPLEELKAVFADIPGQLRIYPGETQWKVKTPYWHFVEMVQSAAMNPRWGCFNGRSRAGIMNTAPFAKKA